MGSPFVCFVSPTTHNYKSLLIFQMLCNMPLNYARDFQFQSFTELVVPVINVALEKPFQSRFVLQAHILL